jgi:surface antigen
MSVSLSRLLAPMAAVYVAFGLFFSLFTREAYADQQPTGVASIAQSPWSVSPTTLAELKADLDQSDRMAVLEAIHVGLSDAPDGSTYMWRRHNGKLAGSIRPTTSFRDADGKVCRYLVFQLLLGEHLRQVEGIACRQGDKSWLLEG